jgi:zinc transporter ZupT
MSIIVILKAVLALISALAGASIIFYTKLNHEKLCSAISFSAGALLGAALFAILPESFENISFLEVVAGALSGYLLFWVISRYYSHVCPACSASHFDEQTTKKFSEIVKALMIALSFHSFLDGLAITAPALGGGHESHSVFVAVTTHKFPEGLALASLMLGANYKKGRILLNIFVVEFTTVLGALVGEYLIKNSLSGAWMGYMMAHIAGGFVFLAFHAVMGEMLKNHKKLVISSFAAGVFLILFVHFLFN